jgi:archaellum component FlaC
MPTSSQPENELPPPSDATDLSDRHWRTKFSDRKAAMAWAVSAGVGAIVISTVPPESGFPRFFVPVAIMVSYVWLHYPRGSFAKSPLGAVRIAQLADSAYFLGFLWTLWALIDSFVLKKATAPDAAFRVFGYALVTTAAGMTIRLFLLHFQTTRDVEVYTVEENLQRFSVATDKACGAIQGFQKSTETLSKKIAMVSQAVDLVDKHVAEVHRQTSQAISDRINTTVDDLRNKVAHLGEAVTSAEHEFAEAHRRTSETLIKAIAATVEETRRPLNSAVAEYEAGIRAFTTDVHQHSRVLTDVVRQTSAVINQTTSAASDSVRQVIEATGAQIASDNLKLMEQTRTQANRINDELRRVAENIRSIQWETGPQISSDTILQLIVSVNSLRQSVQDVGRAVERLRDETTSRERGIWRRVTNLFQR